MKYRALIPNFARVSRCHCEERSGCEAKPYIVSNLLSDVVGKSLLLIRRGGVSTFLEREFRFFVLTEWKKKG